MLNYSGLEALYTVIETQGFHLAGDKLCVTQSAISQRIKAIETFYGRPLIIRSLPYHATPFGLSLLRHYNQVKLLETALNKFHEGTQSLSIAINRDGLGSWFQPILDNIANIPSIILDIIADDEKHTLSYLENGSVSACASITKAPLIGCRADFLGYLDYCLVASPAFKAKYFKSKSNFPHDIVHTRAAIFDKRDDLLNTYLKNFFNIEFPIENCYAIPSVSGLHQYALNGTACTLLPKIRVINDLKKKKLINLYPEYFLEIPVYWHSWAVETSHTKALNNLVLTSGKALLRNL